mmetsp:Transcript_17542/g.68044  ORF Transcript_17542/g.68044 Transcript_17542/m.68044 type:complete len:243 (-) Transcript_17542:880-1608(-)
MVRRACSTAIFVISSCDWSHACTIAPPRLPFRRSARRRSVQESTARAQPTPSLSTSTFVAMEATAAAMRTGLASFFTASRTIFCCRTALSPSAKRKTKRRSFLLPNGPCSKSERLPTPVLRRCTLSIAKPMHSTLPQAIWCTSEGPIWSTLMNWRSSSATYCCSTRRTMRVLSRLSRITGSCESGTASSRPTGIFLSSAYSVTAALRRSRYPRLAPAMHTRPERRRCATTTKLKGTLGSVRW